MALTGIILELIARFVILLGYKCCLLFLDKKQIGVKRRKKIPHFSDYLSGGGDGPPSVGGDGGGGFADFHGFGLFPTFNFMGLPGPSNQGEFNRRYLALSFWSLEGGSIQFFRVNASQV